MRNHAPGRADLGIIDLVTGACRDVPDSAGAANPVWMPDGAGIVFSGEAASDSDSGGNLSGVRCFDLRTGKVCEMTRLFGADPAVSADGRRLALATPNERGTDDLYWFDVETSGHASAVQKLQLLVSVWGGAPLLWLPGTRDLAFIGESAGVRDVYITCAGGCRRISSSGTVRNLAMTRAGRLLWTEPSERGERTGPNLCAYNLETGRIESRPLVTRLRASDGRVISVAARPAQVAISPTGDRALIALPSEPVGAGSAVTSVYAVTLDNGSATLVAQFALDNAHRGSAGPAALSLAWSPDGTRAGVLARARGSGELLVCAADGGGKLVIPVQSQERKIQSQDERTGSR